MNGKLLRQVLDKMLKSPAAGEARVQVCLPDGKYYDITSLQMLENKLIGHRESHRLVFPSHDRYVSCQNLVSGFTTTG